MRRGVAGIVTGWSSLALACAAASAQSAEFVGGSIDVFGAAEWYDNGDSFSCGYDGFLGSDICGTETFDPLRFSADGATSSGLVSGAIAITGEINFTTVSFQIATTAEYCCCGASCAPDLDAFAVLTADTARPNGAPDPIRVRVIDAAYLNVAESFFGSSAFSATGSVERESAPGLPVDLVFPNEVLLVSLSGADGFNMNPAQPEAPASTLGMFDLSLEFDPGIYANGDIGELIPVAYHGRHVYLRTSAGDRPYVGMSSLESAQAFAASVGGYLPVITTFEEELALATLPFTIPTWLGGGEQDIGGQSVFTWSTGEPFAYTGWAQGEPDNGLVERVVATSGIPGGWQDLAPGASSGSVVEVESPVADLSYLGFCDAAKSHYWLTAEPTDAARGRAIAAGCGGTLMTMESQAERDWLAGRLGANQQRYHIGLFQDPLQELVDFDPAAGWCWDMAGPVSDPAWEANQPVEPNFGQYDGANNQGVFRATGAFGWEAWPWWERFTCIIEMPESDRSRLAFLGRHDGSTYFLLQDVLDSRAARQTAEQYDAKLASITSGHEQSWLVGTLQSLGLAGPHWIGGSAESANGPWAWDAGGQAAYTAWLSTEPDAPDTPDDTRIALSAATPGGWDARPPFDRLTSIVEIPSPAVGVTFLGTSGTSEYYATTEPVDAYAARALATSLGAQVLLVDDAAENAAIAGWMTAEGIDSAWIGLSDAVTEGSHAWDDGTARSYTNWEPGEPNDNPSSNGADYARIAATGGWDDTNGLRRRAAIFEKSTISQPPCPGDIDGDGSTLLSDFGILSSNFGQSVPPNTGGDFNGDGQVLLEDFGVLAADFGCTP